MRWRAFHDLGGSLRALITLSFAVALGSYMVTPFIGILMVDGVGMSVPRAGFLVAAATFIQFGGSILGGPVVRRLGTKRTMVGSLALRSLGLVALGAATRAPWLAVPAVVMVAAGPALYLPANKAYIVSTVPDHARPLFLGISSAALNAGMGLGPLLAAVLVDADPLVLMLALAVLFALITVAHHIALRAGGGPESIASPEGMVARNPPRRRPILRDALRPMLYTTLAYYLYFFFQSFMGLYTSALHDINALGWIMLLNCALSVALQPPLSGFIARTDYRALVAGSFALMAGGAALMSFHSLAVLLAGTALFSLGEIGLFLRCDLEMVKRLPDNPAFAFGVQRLTGGVGGLLAGMVGGFLFAHYAGARHPGGFWLTVAVQCVVAAGLVLLPERPRQPATPAPRPELEKVA